MTWRAEPTEFVVKRSAGTEADIIDAVNAALRSGEPRRRVVIPTGDWTLNNPIILAQSGAGAYTHVEIVGQNRVFPGIGNQTRLICNFNDKPAFAIQGQRQILLAHLEILGQNSFTGSLSGIDDVIDDAQMLVGGVRDNRYSPHCAIHIDPFSASAPGGVDANRYPGLESYYTNDYAQNISGGGMLLDNVTCRDFPLGIANSCGGLTQGGDGLVMRDCNLQGCRIGYATGNGQAKECVWQETHFLYGLHAIDCVTYGARQGYPPEMRGSLSGWTKLACNIHHSIGPLAWGPGGFGTEATHGLGQFGFGGASGPSIVTITGKDIHLWNALSAKNIDVHIVLLRPAVFTGCYFNVNDTTGPPGGGAGTIRIHNSNNEWLVFDHCTFGCDAPNGHLPLDFNWAPTVEMRRCKNRSTDIHGVGSLAETQVGGSGNLTFLSPGQAQFTATGAGAACDVGDHIRLSAQYQPRQYAPDGVGFNTACSVGTVIAKASDTITLGQVPETVEATLPINGTSFFRRRFTFA